MMKDFVQLDRQEMIDLRDTRVDHHFGILRDGHRPLEDLRDKFLYQILPPLSRGRLGAETPLAYDFVQQPTLFSFDRSGGSVLNFRDFSHWTPPRCPVHPSIGLACRYCLLPPKESLPACHSLGACRANPRVGFANRGAPSGALPASRYCPVQNRPFF